MPDLDDRIEALAVPADTTEPASAVRLRIETLALLFMEANGWPVGDALEQASIAIVGPPMEEAPEFLAE